MFVFAIEAITADGSRILRVVTCVVHAGEEPEASAMTNVVYAPAPRPVNDVDDCGPNVVVPFFTM
jgi:hypothetical protein